MRAAAGAGRDHRRCKATADFMTSQNSQPDDMVLSDEAIDWVVRLKSGRASADDLAAFAAWRQRSEEHEQAAREAEAIWHGVGIAGSGVRRADRKAKLTRRAVLGAGVLVAGGGALAWSGALGPHLLADHVTGVGEQRSISLDDGSSVLLDAATSLSVEFGARERLLRIHGGQAAFTVAHDPSRPFVVSAGTGWTRAIGTVFDVDVRPREVMVTVVEGAVDIATEAAPSRPVRATVDQRVRYGGSTPPSAPESIDSDMETAWRRGKLVFDRRPLGDVVAQLGRYRDGRIVLVGDRLRSLEVTGVFDLTEPEAVLRAIETTLPVRVTRLPLVTLIR